MVIIDNLTPFATTDFCAVDKDGRNLVVTCVSGTFHLPRPGGPTAGMLPIAEVQEPPPLVDVHVGEPGQSSIREAGQSVYFRPGTDITFEGCAWAPARKPLETLLVGVRVGPWQAAVRVFGERVWTRVVSGLVPSRPRPFESLEVTYERSYGGPTPDGTRHDERNPIGRGFGGVTKDQPLLPNVEDPTNLIGNPRDRPWPAGLGPLARHWQPRAAWGGTYDDVWQQSRAPLWPRDLDERFFCAAPRGLVATPWLVGGEEVTLLGASPWGAFHFTLPRIALLGSTIVRGRSVRRKLRLDAVHFQPELSQMKMVWRMAVPFEDSVAEHELTTIRMLQPWEQS